MSIGPGVRTQIVGNVAVVKLVDNAILHDPIIDHIGNEILTLLSESACKKFILDFSSVDYVNSHTLGMLFKVGKKAKDAKLKLRLCSICDAILEVFKITRLDTYFDIKPTLAAALKGI